MPQILEVVQQHVLDVMGNAIHCFVENLKDIPSVKNKLQIEWDLTNLSSQQGGAFFETQCRKLMKELAPCRPTHKASPLYIDCCYCSLGSRPMLDLFVCVRRYAVRPFIEYRTQLAPLYATVTRLHAVNAVDNEATPAQIATLFRSSAPMAPSPRLFLSLSAFSGIRLELELSDVTGTSVFIMYCWLHLVSTKVIPGFDCSHSWAFVGRVSYLIYVCEASCFLMA